MFQKAETFVGFLKDIASPDEINDYVQTYLGSNKISRDFAKNFITKRSYLRNKARQIEPYEVCLFVFCLLICCINLKL